MAAEPEGRGAFGGLIGPRTLLGLVENTAPWLFARTAGEVGEASSARPSEVAAGPEQWRAILRAGEQLEPSPEPKPEQRTDYFALCLAAHFASAATYVPTDVDSKIRRALWHEAVGTDQLPRMRRLALGLVRWDLRAVSARIVPVDGAGEISGHDGERLAVLCGGLVASLEARDERGARELEDAIDAELAREARAFECVARSQGSELDLLRLASILTHNAGDVMQGLAAAASRPLGAAPLARFGELARERFERYGGAFGRAAALYRELLASEGHRNYPLRKPRALRRGAELLLPIAPFLDAWGERIATSLALGTADRAEIVAALVEGCRKLPGQSGYARALAGFARAWPRGLEAPELAPHHPASVKRALRDAQLRKALAVKRESFEASLAKRARALLA
ncbi:MAG: hypothetical protein WEF50_14320 [Myxococcota bacterium]